MRTFAALFLLSLVAAGCVRGPERDRSQGLVFNIRSSDVMSASAEPIDLSRFPTSTHENAPVLKAQLHIMLNDDAAARFQRFNERHSGQDYELQVNGEALRAAVGAASGFGGSEMWWFVGSVEEAERLAASLNKK